VENSRVVKHVESFQSDVIIGGYVRMVMDERGTDRFFIYRKSDWESWRKKSANPRTVEKVNRNGGKYLSESLWDNGIVGGTQPEPNFLRTKIIKHAAKEKCWATGQTPASVETFAEVEIDSDDMPQRLSEEFTTNVLPVSGPQQPVIDETKHIANKDMDDEDFASNGARALNGHVVNDDDF
jgi:hypothetical protein